MSNSSGAANDVAISNATGLNFTRATTGADASLTVDGIPIDSASNTVTGVVPGVTFNLVSAAPGVQVNVSTSTDADKASQAVKDFVSAYNAVISDVNQEFAVGQNGTQGPLSGDSTLRMLQSMLLGSASFPGTGDITSLAGLGINMNNDGTLTVDDATLSGAIQGDFAGVKTFFQGTASDGFASTLNTQLKSMTDAVSGAFTVDLQSITNEVSDLQNHIDNFKTFLQSEQARLTDEFNKAATLLQQLPILEQQINAELGGLNNNNNGNKG
jgi:flagellar hook-associated protein 2